MTGSYVILGAYRPPDVKTVEGKVMKTGCGIWGEYFFI
jgi:hypothetical protein